VFCAPLIEFRPLFCGGHSPDELERLCVAKGRNAASRRGEGSSNPKG